MCQEVGLAVVVAGLAAAAPAAVVVAVVGPVAAGVAELSAAAGWFGGLTSY